MATPPPPPIVPCKQATPSYPAGKQPVPDQPKIGNPPVAAPQPYGRQKPEDRAMTARAIRIGAADFEYKQPLPEHISNDDEKNYADIGFIGNYSKGMPHDSSGRVSKADYKKLIAAANSGQPCDWGNVPQGGNISFVNPQAGLAFDLEGADAHSLCLPPAFPVLSMERAAEAIELYWMALCRDVPFTEYGNEPLTTAAITELSALPAALQTTVFGAPVTAQTLFRGATPGEQIGPYVSQFFMQAAPFGDLAVQDPLGQNVQKYIAYQPGLDYMTSKDWWLLVQNGMSPYSPAPPNAQFGANNVIGPRFLFAGRCGAAFVHVDELYQAYFMAALNLLDSLKPDSYDVNNPYQKGTSAGGCNYKNQAGFGTFGNPHIATLVAEVATRALKAQWFQKWFVHRTLRPEEYGGLVHFAMTGSVDYKLPDIILNSKAVQTTFTDNGSYFLPQAFPEGSPQHPSYGSGHATVAGACATIIKAFFNETMEISNPVVAGSTSAGDGTVLVPYTGGEKLCVGHEANKIAGNVGMFRNHAGVHWRSDHQESIKLGERIGIRILQDQKWLYNEEFGGWDFTTFEGTPIII